MSTKYVAESMEKVARAEKAALSFLRQAYHGKQPLPLDLKLATADLIVADDILLKAENQAKFIFPTIPNCGRCNNEGFYYAPDGGAPMVEHYCSCEHGKKLKTKEK